MVVFLVFFSSCLQVSQASGGKGKGSSSPEFKGDYNDDSVI